MDIESVRASHEDQLMQLPNVNGVGIGKKGQKDVIKAFVTRKIPETSLEPHQVVPRSIGDFRPTSKSSASCRHKISSRS